MADDLPNPPAEGWTLEEAMRAICPAELREWAEAEQRASEAMDVANEGCAPDTRADAEIKAYWLAYDCLVASLRRPLQGHQLRATARCGKDQPREEVPFDRWDTIDWFNIEGNAVGERRPDGRTYYGVRILKAYASNKADSNRAPRIEAVAAPVDGAETIETSAARTGARRGGRTKRQSQKEEFGRLIFSYWNSGKLPRSATNDEILRLIVRCFPSLTKAPAERTISYAKAFARALLEAAEPRHVAPTSDDRPA